MNDKLDQLLSMNLFELHKYTFVLAIFIVIHLVPGLIIGLLIDLNFNWYPSMYEFLDFQFADEIYCFYLGYLSRLCWRGIWKKVKAQN